MKVCAIPVKLIKEWECIQQPHKWWRNKAKKLRLLPTVHYVSVSVYSTWNQCCVPVASTFLTEWLPLLRLNFYRNLSCRYSKSVFPQQTHRKEALFNVSYSQWRKPKTWMIISTKVTKKLNHMHYYQNIFLISISIKHPKKQKIQIKATTQQILR